MTKYRDSLTESEGTEIGSVVGCGLDRINRPITDSEIQKAIQFYRRYKDEIDSYPISARRQMVQEFIEGKVVIPYYITK